jgi:putative ABC transport system permease protein
MLKTTIAGMRARTTRLVLSSIAIILGVAFVSGTLVLGNALDANVRNDFARQTRGVDVSVQMGANSTETSLPLDQAALAQLREVPGVAGADGRAETSVPLTRADGKTKPVSISTLEDTPSLREFDLSSGRFPTTTDEIAIEATTTETTKLAVGQKVSVVGADNKPVPLTVVGVYTQGTSARSRYGDQAVMVPSAVLSLSKTKGFYQIVLSAAPGVSQQQLANRVNSTLRRSDLNVQTGEQLTTETLQRVSRGSGGVTQIMLVFAIIALIVAAMVIYNTFTILVAQRTRELALLRCIGADRGQVFRGMLLEALVMGLFASVVGLGAGIGLSALLQSAAGTFFRSGGGPVQTPVTLTVVLAAFGVGVLVTVVSAALPALRATRVAPLAALRTVSDSHDEIKRTSAVRLAFVAILAIVGAGICAFGMRGGSGQSGFVFTGVGTMVLLLAVIVLGPVIVGPVNRLLGALPKVLFGVPAKLATANAGRNPKRTAATTAALMIGVTLVTMITVVASSGKQSAAAEVEKDYPADYVISSSVYDSSLPVSLAQQLGKLDQVASVSSTASTKVTVGTKTARLTGIDPSTIGSTFVDKAASGDLGKLASGTVALSSSEAKYLGLVLGDQAQFTSPTGKQSLTVVAILQSEGNFSAVITLDSLSKLAAAGFGYDRIFVKIKPGISPETSQAAVEKTTQPVAVAKVDSAAAAKAKVIGQIDQMLALMWALIGLAVVIALFGIANTLSLSVLERLRESALLRALGLTKGQLRGMLLIESVLMGLMGAVIGVLLGGGFAKLLVMALSSEKMQLSFTVPYAEIGVMLVAAVAAAILAAVLPARRAARTSIVSGMVEA